MQTAIYYFSSSVLWPLFVSCSPYRRRGRTRLSTLARLLTMTGARAACDSTIPSKAPTNADAAPRSPPLAPSPLHARISRFGRACPYPRPFMLPASEQPPSVGALLGPAPPASRSARRSPHPGAGSSRVRGFEKWRRRRRRRRQTDRRRIARVSGVLVRARACL